MSGRRPKCKPYRLSDNAIRVCLSKRVYSTRADADLAVAEIWADTGRDLSKYTCNVCKRYHLTSRQRWTE